MKCNRVLFIMNKGLVHQKEDSKLHNIISNNELNVCFPPKKFTSSDDLDYTVAHMRMDYMYVL